MIRRAVVVALILFALASTPTAVDAADLKRNIFTDASQSPLVRVYGTRAQVLQFHRRYHMLLCVYWDLEYEVTWKMQQEIRQYERDGYLELFISRTAYLPRKAFMAARY